MATVTKRHLRNALKSGTAGEINSKQGRASAEGMDLAPTNGSEVGEPQVELNGAIGEALITKNVPQCPRTKLVFDVRIDNPFLD